MISEKGFIEMIDFLYDEGFFGKEVVEYEEMIDIAKEKFSFSEPITRFCPFCEIQIYSFNELLEEFGRRVCQNCGEKILVEKNEKGIVFITSYRNNILFNK